MSLATFRTPHVALIGLLVLIGCSLSPTKNVVPKLKGIGGNIHGGQQPVSGSTIQLYTVGTTGDGTTATPMLTSTVKSDANGNFEFGGLFSCTNATLVYLTATGGDPGLGSNNPNLLMMTAIGPCLSITTNTFVTINERTTVAAVAALAPFMSAPGSPVNIGSSAADVSGLTAAFALASELVDPATGDTPGQSVPPGMTVPSTEINTLADVLSTCVNSAGGVAGDSSACGTLFSLTTPTNAAAPTNIVGALLNLANNPTMSTAALYSLAPATAPFQPQLTTAPPDFQIRLTPPTSSMALQFSPASVAFPPTSVGFTSPAQQVTITNTGSATVTISTIGLAGQNVADFAETNTCTSALQPTQTCIVQVTTTPAALGSRNGYLKVVSSTPDSPQYVPLTGTGVAPSAGPVYVNPTSLSFTVGNSSQDITLSNFGSTPLTIKSITSSNSSFTTTSNCGTVLAAESLCTITVQSSGLGTYSGVLTINDDASTGPQTVALQAANTMEIVSDSYGFDLGTWGIGTTSGAPRNFYYVLETASPSGQSIGGYAFTGLNAGDFSGTGCTIQPRSISCSFQVYFTPSAVGVRTASLLGVKFTGTGQAAGPSFLTDLPTIPTAGLSQNAASATGIERVTNNGTTPLTLSYSLSGPNAANFSLNTGGNPPSLPAGQYVDTSLTFTASSPGTYSAILTITDTTSSLSKAVPLTATAAYEPPVATPGLGFAPEVLGVTSAPQTVTISDFRSQPLGHPISISLQPSSNFTLPQGSSCPASTTQLCTLSVAFDPHVTGDISEYLTVTDVTSGLSSTLPMTGYGAVPTLSLSAGSITFPATSLGTTSAPVTVTLKNTSLVSLTVSQISIVGAVQSNFVETNDCTTVAPNSTCSINVLFAPTAAGPQSATIKIVSNASSSPDTIAISGSTD